MILNNILTPITFWSDNQHQVLDVFSHCSGNKKITLLDHAHVIYVAIFDHADVYLDINLGWSSAHGEFFWIFLGNVDARVVASLLANTTFARLHLYCVVGDDVDMSVDGNIYIPPHVEQVEWYLMEEQFLLWNHHHLRIRPLLDVHSHRVKASHWAKIHTLDSQKLFYMMAKGLSLYEAQKIVIQSSLQSVFDRLSDIDTQQKEEIFNQLITTIFTSWYSW